MTFQILQIFEEVIFFSCNKDKSLLNRRQFNSFVQFFVVIV